MKGLINFWRMLLCNFLNGLFYKVFREDKLRQTILVVVKKVTCFIFFQRLKFGVPYRNVVLYSLTLMPSLFTGCKINYFSDSHFAPKFFKVVANSVGHDFQRQTKPFVSVLDRPSKIKLGKRSFMCYKVDTRMEWYTTFKLT